MGDMGRRDMGRGDMGRGDMGRGDTGRGHMGSGHTGRGDTGILSQQQAPDMSVTLCVRTTVMRMWWVGLIKW